MTIRNYEGACHYGALSYRYDTALVTADWPVRACQCSFCRLHTALTSSDPAGTLSFHADDLSDLQRYRFGARTADFLVCRRRGAYPGATIRSSASGYGLAQRKARRESLWTPLASDSV